MYQPSWGPVGVLVKHTFKCEMLDITKYVQYKKLLNCILCMTLHTNLFYIGSLRTPALKRNGIPHLQNVDVCFKRKLGGVYLGTYIDFIGVGHFGYNHAMRF